MGDATACQAIDEELSSMMSRLESLVGEVREARELTQRKLKEPAASTHLKLCKRKISELKTEAGKLENQTVKEVYLKKVTSLEAQNKAYVKELKDLITPEKKGPKVVSGQEAIMGEGGATGENFTSAAQVLAAANRGQDENLEILRRTRVILAATEEVGHSIAETLAKQSEEISQINKDLGTLQSQINRAKGDLMWFARQMAGDKCFMCLLAMVILALLILVGWKVYDKRNGGTGNVATTTAAPSSGGGSTPATPATTAAGGTPVTASTTTVRTATTTTTAAPGAATTASPGSATGTTGAAATPTTTSAGSSPAAATTGSPIASPTTTAAAAPPPATTTTGGGGGTSARGMKQQDKSSSTVRRIARDSELRSRQHRWDRV